MSKLRPILFSTEMVRAILDGRKTQTRRVVKNPENYYMDEMLDGLWPYKSIGNPAKCPYGKVGDVLWIKETWACLRLEYDFESGLVDGINESDRVDLAKEQIGCFNPNHVFTYRTDPHEEHIEDRGFKWKPSIHMPFAAARIFLRVKNVRVERLHEISDEDAIAEGIDTDLWDMAIVSRNYKTKDGWFVAWSYEHWSCENISVDVDEVYRKSFQSLWESINGSESWETNPWVWVVEFEPISKEEAMQ